MFSKSPKMKGPQKYTSALFSCFKVSDQNQSQDRDLESLLDEALSGFEETPVENVVEKGVSMSYWVMNCQLLVVYWLRL